MSKKERKKIERAHQFNPKKGNYGKSRNGDFFARKWDTVLIELRLP